MVVFRRWPQNGISKYQEWLTQEGLLKLEGWARDGCTDKEIAANIGINPDTLYTWKKKFPILAESLKKGKDVVDRQVEKSLLQRALGYSYEEISEKYEDGVMTERKVTKKHVVPDTTAQIFWLKNRKPEQWRDKPQSESAIDKALAKAIEILFTFHNVSINSRPPTTIISSIVFLLFLSTSFYSPHLISIFLL